MYRRGAGSFLNLEMEYLIKHFLPIISLLFVSFYYFLAILSFIYLSCCFFLVIPLLLFLPCHSFLVISSLSFVPSCIFLVWYLFLVYVFLPCYIPFVLFLLLYFFLIISSLPFLHSYSFLPISSLATPPPLIIPSNRYTLYINLPLYLPSLHLPFACPIAALTLLAGIIVKTNPQSKHTHFHL